LQNLITTAQSREEAAANEKQIYLEGNKTTIPQTIDG
jgi:hypothetical protein